MLKQPTYRWVFLSHNWNFPPLRLNILMFFVQGSINFHEFVNVKSSSFRHLKSQYLQTTNLRIFTNRRINGLFSLLSQTVKSPSCFLKGYSKVLVLSRVYTNKHLSWSVENPVATTELTVYQTLVPEFDNRGVKLIVLAPDTIEAHNEWIKEI